MDSTLHFTHPQQVLPGLQRVHEVLRVDVDHGVEHVEPLGQVLLHGVQVLVRPGEAAQLPLLDQLEADQVIRLLGDNSISGSGQLGHSPRNSLGGSLALVQLLLQLLFEAFLQILELLGLWRHEAGPEAATGAEAASLEVGGGGGRARGLEARPEVKACHPELSPPSLKLH